MTIRTHPVFLYDAFTDRALGGNIAGVVPDAEGLSSGEMQAVARELGAPTTAFLLARRGGLGLRFFTPDMEIDMCGHAALGAVTCWYENQLAAGSPRSLPAVSTPGGDLRTRIDAAAGGELTVGLGLEPARLGDRPPDAASLLDALGVDAEALAPDIGPRLAYTGLTHVLVPLKEPGLLKEVRVLVEALRAWCRQYGVHTAGVFALEPPDSGSPFVSRLRDFCPAIGAVEEAASGTTNAALAALLWATGALARAGQTGDRITIWNRQGEEMGRPSTVGIELRLHQGSVSETWILGRAVRSLEGRIRL